MLGATPCRCVPSATAPAAAQHHVQIACISTVRCSPAQASSVSTSRSIAVAASTSATDGPVEGRMYHMDRHRSHAAPLAWGCRLPHAAPWVRLGSSAARCRPAARRPRWLMKATTTQESGTQQSGGGMFLSDIIAFQSSMDEGDGGTNNAEVESAAAKADHIIERATQVLEAARAALAEDAPPAPPPPRQRAARASPSRPSTNRFTPESVNRMMREQGRQAGPAAADGDQGFGVTATDDRKRRVLQKALQAVEVSQLEAQVDEWHDSPGSAPGSAPTASWTPDWAQGFVSDGGSFGPLVMQPFLAPQAGARQDSRLAFADPEAEPQVLNLRSQAAEDAERARQAELPPLQSLLELTTAWQPPSRAGAVVEGEEAVEGAGMVTATSLQAQALPDGKAVLQDGSRFEKLSGDEKGEHGYWCRWHLLRGFTGDSSVAWEETWWETSDWFGLKEMGAEKKGTAEDGSSWKERWTEKVYFHPDTLEPVVERSAHKWAVDANGDEWEEKWTEYYAARGRVKKSADKWGKEGANVWHETWGEDYDGKGACVKWTDKWAERVVSGGAREEWGDKWEERFGDGKGEKKGEVWSMDASGHRYNRYWGEEHFGNGTVRRYGHSTGGEQWDFTEGGDTYYNPIPHFGFKHAYSHSPQLHTIPVLPKEDPQGRFGGLGPGMDAL